jgi:LacI family transcriptional regulator
VRPSRAATLKNVAQRAGVHVATASRALSDDRAHLVGDATRDRVRAAADELGYVGNALARGLRTGASGTIGVVVADLENPFVVAVLRGIEEECAAYRCLPLVAETHDDPARLRQVVNRLVSSRVDAVILSAVQRGDEQLVAELEGRLPVVLAVRGLEPLHDGGQRHLQVLPDDRGGARSAVRHLVGLGHRRIAQLRGTPSISSFVERAAGFADAIAESPGATDVSTPGHAAESSVAEGRRLTLELLRGPEDRRPTGIFAHNDRMAVGCLDALRESGLHCPADVSVVGYNDVPLVDHLEPPLTTVRLPGRDVGRHSARLCFEALSFDALAGAAAPPAPLVLEPELVVRGSTGAPRRV